MKIKEKSVHSKSIIIVTILIMLSLLTVVATQVYAVHVWSSGEKEIFKDDLGMLNSEEVPTHLFADEGITFFCSEHLTDVDGYMTATQAHLDNYLAKVEGATGYSEGNPMWFYRRPGQPGLVANHRKEWGEFCSYVKGLTECCPAVTPPYDGDDQALIDSLRASLPGIGKPRVKAIDFHVAGGYSAEANQDAAYIMSNYPQYGAWEHPPEAENVDYSLRTL